MKPTDELYDSLQAAYQFFNQSLFENRLPSVIFTVQRQSKVLGYFAPDRWTSLNGNRCHEIAINPTHMGDSRLIEVLQTLVHEMVHCWQHCFGNPARSCYHNKEWAFKMQEIGLQPTSTGLPGGAIVGQQMSDYPIKDGRFLKSCFLLINNRKFNFPWIDRRLTPKSIHQENAANQTLSLAENLINEGQDVDNLTVSNSILSMSYSDLMPENTFYAVPSVVNKKSKYQCPNCFINVWGKPELNLICGNCKRNFLETF